MTNYLFKGLMALATFAITQSSIAQAPQKMSYQAVIRDVSNAAVINTTVGMRISILQGSAAGTSVYVETQTPMTNAVGLVTIEVGTGTVVSGIFSSINWSTGLFWIKTETDPLGGTAYSIFGNAQLLSVPYAFYAGSSTGSWGLTGNSGTGSTNFIGTIDDQPLIFKVNNEIAGRLDNTSNTTFGRGAFPNNTVNRANTVFGTNALHSNTDGYNNVAIGAGTLFYNNHGAANVAIGLDALSKNTNGNLNIAIGRSSMLNNVTGIQNIAIGDEALLSNLVGGGNIAIGHRVLKFSTAEFNVGVGHNALTYNTTGGSNTALGYFALFNNNTGHSNTAVGTNSMEGNKNGTYNAAGGYWALKANEDNYGNTAFGALSLVNTKANLNTGIGSEALRNNTTGYENTSIGDRSLNTNITGTYNTAVGTFADVGVDGLTNATAIGAGSVVNANNTIQLGNAAVTKVYAGTGTTATVVTGGLQVTGGSLGAGKVLTSDATGVATWQTPSGASGWSLNGNTGTNPATNFIGTNDDASLNFRANGAIAGRIDPYYSSGNTFLGGSAGISNDYTAGGFNSAFGRGALHFNVSGSSNTTIGVNSLFHNVVGNGGTAVGFEAMAYYLNPEGSVAVGFQALRGYPIPAINTGLQNTALGVTTLIDNTSGGNNTASGYAALFINTTGSNNTANGSHALTSNTTGSNNTAVGKGADVIVNNLTNATAIGFNAIVNASNTIQLGNAAVTKVYAGTGTTATLVTGGLQVTGGIPAVGKLLTSDASGVATWQTPSGGSGWSLTGNSGTVDGINFIGTTDNVPLNFKVNGIIAGRIDPYYSLGNTFLGGSTGISHSNTTGEFNSAFGRGALYYNVNGSSNTAVGVASLHYNLGNGGTAIGFETLGFPNAEGSVAVGYRALRGNTVPANNTGLQNTAVGVNTLIDNSSGGNNTASGYQALFTNTIGSNNTATGSNALTTNTTGSNNTAVGKGADVASGTLTNATAIGANAIVDASNKVRIGNTAVTVIEGQVAYSFPSDARFKFNIQPNVPGLAFINKLKPVTYLFDEKKLANYTKTGQLDNNSNDFINVGYNETSKIVHTGFLAQDIEKICKEMGYEFDGLHKPSNDKDHYSLAYSQFIMPLVKGMQEQQLQIEEQKQINKQQNEKLQLLEKQIEELKLLVEKLK